MITALLCRLYPACAGTGTQGLPIPDPVNLVRWVEHNPAHAALAAPEDFGVPPDIPTQARALNPEALYAALLRVGGAQPRTWLAAAYPTRLQLHFVARTARLNFPDMIVVEARAHVLGSVAVMFSQSVYGRAGAGIGTQRRRLQDWLGALDAELTTTAEG